MTSDSTLSLFGQKKVFSVSELTDKIKSTLERAIGAVWVSGQVTNLRQPGSGHLYFAIKDENSQIRCVLFDSTRRLIKFRIEDGMEVVIFGKVTVYKKSGEYQIIIDSLEPKGKGALQLAFEQLKKKLEAEGLFDEARKRPLPFLPRTIGIVTSLTGAAIQDILNIIERRFPTIHIIIYPVKVQGEGAKEEIAEAIDNFNNLTILPDVLIVGRGGGSIEDLWAFNEEIVARAISRSKIPVISAVGHEIDYTIADLVADRRALTPSEAAEIVLPIKAELDDKLNDLKQELKDSLLSTIELAKANLESLTNAYALVSPQNRIREYYQRSDGLSERLFSIIKQKMEMLNLEIAGKSARLNSLSPLNILARGYTVTRLESDRSILNSVKQVNSGDRIVTQLSDGQIDSIVEKKR